MARRRMTITGRAPTSEEVGKILGVSRSRMAKLSRQTAALLAKPTTSARSSVKSAPRKPAKKVPAVSRQSQAGSAAKARS